MQGIELRFLKPFRYLVWALLFSAILLAGTVLLLVRTRRLLRGSTADNAAPDLVHRSIKHRKLGKCTPVRHSAMYGLHTEEDRYCKPQDATGGPGFEDSFVNSLDAYPHFRGKDGDQSSRQATAAPGPHATITTLYSRCYDALPQQQDTADGKKPISSDPAASTLRHEDVGPVSGSLVEEVSPCDSALNMQACSTVTYSSISSSCPSRYSSDDSSMDLVDDLEDADQLQKLPAGNPCSAGEAGAGIAAGPGGLELLQDLRVVASCRKGYAVLNPAHQRSFAGHLPAAAEAGSQSVRTRLVVTEVSVYCNDLVNKKCWSNSPLALEQANTLMTRMTLPDAVTYMPVTSDSWIFQAAASLQFPSFVICLGSSYLQRMLTTLPKLAEAAAAVPEFERYCSYLPAKAQPTKPNQPLSGHELATSKATMRSIQFTCLFLALKVADRVHALGLLRYIMTKISHDQRLVSLDDAAAVEAQCLAALGWRLGPWFGEADLTGNDEELWAAAMGTEEYGTSNDCWQ